MLRALIEKRALVGRYDGAFGWIVRSTPEDNSIPSLVDAARPASLQAIRRNHAATWFHTDPIPADDPSLVIVVGDLRHPRKPIPSRDQRLPMIPELGLYAHMAVLRAIGRGKTSPFIYPCAGQVIPSRRDVPERRIGGMVRDVKGDVQGSMSTRPGKHHVAWNAEGLSQHQAESLRRALAGEFAPDPAETDTSHVHGMPGFFNHNCAEPFLCRARKLFDWGHRPKHFTGPPDVEPGADFEAHRVAAVCIETRLPANCITMSERHWAYSHHALSRGESGASAVAAIAACQCRSKRKPACHAEPTLNYSLKPRRVEAGSTSLKQNILQA